MKVGIYYKAVVKDEAKIEEIVERFDNGKYKSLKLDFPLSKRYFKSTLTRTKDNFEEYMKEAYHDWAKSCLMVYGVMPSRFKGILFDLDPEAGSLGLVFGKFNDHEWKCNNYLPTHKSTKGFQTHMDAVNLLKELQPFVDELEVDDETGFWQTGNLQSAKKKFYEGLYGKNIWPEAKSTEGFSDSR
jgi:hypothetical protein